jgi:hypothetical protein
MPPPLVCTIDGRQGRRILQCVGCGIDEFDVVIWLSATLS